MAIDGSQIRIQARLLRRNGRRNRIAALRHQILKEINEIFSGIDGVGNTFSRIIGLGKDAFDSRLVGIARYDFVIIEILVLALTRNVISAVNTIAILPDFWVGLANLISLVGIPLDILLVAVKSFSIKKVIQPRHHSR